MSQIHIFTVYVVWGASASLHGISGLHHVSLDVNPRRVSEMAPKSSPTMSHKHSKFHQGRWKSTYIIYSQCLTLSYIYAFPYLCFETGQHLCLPTPMCPTTAYKSVSKKDTYLSQRCLVLAGKKKKYISYPAITPGLRLGQLALQRLSKDPWIPWDLGLVSSIATNNLPILSKLQK